MTRTTSLLRGLTLAALVLMPVGCGNAQLPPDPPSAIPTAELVKKHFPSETIIQDLPWEFSVSTEQSDAGETTQTLFVSNKPIQNSPAGNVFLRASLTTRIFDTSTVAAEAFAEQVHGADPDTGLTYAWDLVLLDDTRIHHLHADCLFSEEAFDTMSANLYRVISGDTPRALRCRCGGGCRQTNAVDQ